MSTRSLASRLDSGSSNRNTRGLRTSARPIATRWRWPPESWLGRRSSRCSICSVLATSATAASRSRLRHAAHLHAERHVLLDRHVRDRARRTGTPWRCRAWTGCRSLIDAPSMRISPSLIVSSPAIVLSRVDLPQPDGPTSTRKPPLSSVEVDALEDLQRAEALASDALISRNAIGSTL